MSYCVNCGVELDQNLPKCPLCNTPVYHPDSKGLPDTVILNKEESGEGAAHTFPQKHGQVEEVKRHDLGLLISIVLGGTAFSSLMLNLLVLQGNWWSLLIIGACVILFFLAFPAFIYTKTPVYVSILFDGLSTALYLYFITFVTPSKAWFGGLALPIVGLATAVVLVFVWLLRTFKVTVLTTSFYFFTLIALFCMGLELLVDRYYDNPLRLFWSAIVLTICGVIDSALLTVLSRRRLRDAVRRRLHF